MISHVVFAVEGLKGEAQRRRAERIKEEAERSEAKS